MPQTSISRKRLLAPAIALVFLGILSFLPGNSTRALSERYLPPSFLSMWDRQLLSVDAVSDSIVFLSCIAIAVILIRIAYRNRREIPSGWTFVAFFTFIAACGLSHILGVVAHWHPIPGLIGQTKLVTAFASATTAYLLLPLAPQIRRMIKDAAIAHTAQIDRDRTHAFTRSIIDSSSFSILVTDRQGRIVTANPATERMLWYPAGELIGRRNIVALVDPLDLATRAFELSAELGADIAPDAHTLTLNASKGLVDEGDWTFLRKDGSPISVHLTVSANYGHNDIEGFVFTAFDITERLRSQEHLRHVATHDALTGLPTRVLLRDRLNIALARANRYNQPIAVIMIDLDNFKRINDSLGHQAGDEVLTTVAQRLREGVRTTDTVARMGGDEFVIILTDLREAKLADQVAQTLLDSLSRSIVVDQQELFVTASMGICTDSATADPVTLLKNADVALYRSKSAGKNQIVTFTENMQYATIEKLQIEANLRLAIERDELEVHYQPQFSLLSSECIGMEALLRWQRGEQGTVMPGDFIPVAEETGLIVPIGNWVLQQACIDAVQIAAELGRPMTVAVNISPRQFQDKGLFRNIETALATSGLAATCLELEITENVLIQDSQDSVELLAQIRNLGIRVSIDDFGTGFSSMSYITRFAIDRLKIDQSFVRNVVTDANNRAVTTAIIAMAHGLGVSALAEGVETPEQLAFLLEHECDEAQGYHFSKPLPKQAFIARYKCATNPGAPSLDSET